MPAAGIGAILGQLLESLGGAPDGAHQRIFQELRPWAMTLVPAAARKWLPAIASGARCATFEVSTGPCPRYAVAVCDVCQQMVCLHHSRIDCAGDAICFGCVSIAMQTVPEVLRRHAARQQAERQAYANAQAGAGAPPPNGAPPPRGRPPSDLEVRGALQALGLKSGATWVQVKGAHRKLSGTHHPDKYAVGTKKHEAALGRFKEIQAALDVLKRHYPEAA